MNLLSEMLSYFPSSALQLLQRAGEIAQGQNRRLFLIGGSIRDMLLQRPFDWDLDLVVEQQGAAEIARELQHDYPGKLATYAQFGTAKLSQERLQVDIATARTEIYGEPCSEPQVSFSDLAQDLQRRDFTINAMAIELAPERFGNLIDRFGGLADLKQRRLQALYAGKFIEDPVRSWRASRLAQTLGFELTADTRQWIIIAMQTGWFDNFVSERIKKELLNILQKPNPWHHLASLQQLEVLRCLSPSLILSPAFFQALQQTVLVQGSLEGPTWQVYLLLLLNELPVERQTSLLIQLQLPQSFTRIWQDWHLLRERLPELLTLSLSSSRLYHLLENLSPLALWAAMTQGNPLLNERIDFFWQQLRSVKPLVSGKLLLDWLGPGPAIRNLLRYLLDARLDQQITTYEEEMVLARQWVEQHANI